MHKLLSIICLFLIFTLPSCMSVADNDYCIGWQPIYITEQDINYISDHLAKQLLTHNEYGKIICNWN
ncbi:hypothetical protein [Bartonella sp. DGB1]|uniref:hypothetical protein n=1 Tax=Bartonella sp. DGB1 TaxID=3239807 RepID=UPI0035252474